LHVGCFFTPLLEIDHPPLHNNNSKNTGNIAFLFPNPQQLTKGCRRLPQTETSLKNKIAYICFSIFEVAATPYSTTTSELGSTLLFLICYNFWNFFWVRLEVIDDRIPKI
jgi:hypothetical protein